MFDIDRIVIATGSAFAVWLFFGDRALWVACVAGVLAWMYQEIALVVGLCALVTWTVFEIARRRNGRASQTSDSNVVDAEFKVVSHEENPRWRSWRV